MQRKLSKNMSANTRPPLTSRIRASFDGKRSKSEVTSPTTNGFITHDPDSLQLAVNKAINSEAFQSAVAESLAKIIKPSIKSALDTIQPVVETVYNHEVLLRKTNQSVENILERLETVTEAAEEDENGDPSTPITPQRRSRILTSSGTADIEPVRLLLAENNSQIDGKLFELSKSVDTNNSKIAEVTEGIAGINASLWPTREILDSLRSTSETSNTTISVMQAQLDQLNADVGTILDALGTDFGTNIKAMSKQVAALDLFLLDTHTTKLDAISSDLVVLKGQAGMADVLNDISAKVESLKENVQVGITSSNENLATISLQIANVLEAVRAHSNKLAEINTGDSNADLLTAVQKSNDSHAAHATALGELKERGVATGSESAAVSSDPEATVVLRALVADLTSLKDTLAAGLATNNENASIVGIKVDDVLTTLEAHRAADQSADILAAVHKSNHSHASHAEALEGMKSINVVPRLAAEGGVAPSLETQLTSIIAALETHTAILRELKTSGLSAAPEAAPVPGNNNIEGLESHITSIASTLESHTALLNEIKDDVSAEILTVLHDINEGHARQNAILSEIRESDVSAEILTALHASNDSHSNHTAVLADLYTAVEASNESHASHAEVLDEIKSTKSVEPRSVEAALIGEVPSNLGGLEAQLSTIITTLEDQDTTLSAIRDATRTANGSHVAYALDLAEIKSATTSSNELTTLQNHINEIITSLDSQNATLSAIHESTASPEVMTSVTSTHELLQSHMPLLEAIRDAQLQDEVLAKIEALRAVVEEARESHGGAVGALHEATTSAHKETAAAVTALAVGDGALLAGGSVSSAEVLEEIKAVRAIVEKTSLSVETAETKKPDANSSTEILEEVEAIRTVVEKSGSVIENVRQITTSTKDQIEINQTTVTTSITTLGDELRAEVDASGTEIMSAASSIDLALLEGRIMEVGSEVKGLGVKFEGLGERVKRTGEYVVGFVDGVHINEKGLGQLKEHAAVALPGGNHSFASENAMEKNVTPGTEEQPGDLEPEVEEPVLDEGEEALMEPAAELIALPEIEKENSHEEFGIPEEREAVEETGIPEQPKVSEESAEETSLADDPPDDPNPGEEPAPIQEAQPAPTIEKGSSPVEEPEAPHPETPTNAGGPVASRSPSPGAGDPTNSPLLEADKISHKEEVVPDVLLEPEQTQEEKSTPEGAEATLHPAHEDLEDLTPPHLATGH
jgi:hypothetical protein